MLLNRGLVVVKLIQKKEARVGRVAANVKLATAGLGFAGGLRILCNGCSEGLNPGQMDVELDNKGLHVQNDAISRGSHKDSCGR